MTIEEYVSKERTLIADCGRVVNLKNGGSMYDWCKRFRFKSIK